LTFVSEQAEFVYDALIDR